jgi:hypothetical protein
MKDHSGKSCHCRALLDGGSFITTVLAKRLNLKITSTNIPVYLYSMQHVVLPVSGTTEAVIYSNCNSYKTKLLYF